MMPPTVDVTVNPNVPRYTPPKRGAGDAMMSTTPGPFQAGLDPNVPTYTPAKRAARDATATEESAVFQDALFMLAVRPKDIAQNGDALPLFQSVMPSDAVVALDQRGGLAARAPPRRGVQLLTKHNVSAALYSQHDSLLAGDLIDQFIGHRDTSSNDPRARANALRAWLKRLHDEKHVFSLALFDDSGRAFAAWTPHSAPLSFGHAADGSAVVIAAAPHKRTLVGAGVAGGQINLTHLPAGRFVYGHGYLKPFEFTSLWSTAEGNRGGALRVMRTVDARASPDAPPVDDHRLSPEEKKKWRWDFTGSVAEQATRWTSAIAAARGTPERVSSKVSPPLSVDAPAFSAKKAFSSLSVADAATAAARRLDFAIGVWTHFAFRGGLARVNRYDQRPDKRFLTLLLMRQAVFVDGTNSRAEKTSERVAALGDASATLLNKTGGVSVLTEQKAQTQVLANAHSSASVRLGLVAAVKRATRAASKRKSQKDSARLLAVPARVKAGAANKASSVVMCDLNGRCCVGDHCFFA